MIELEHATKKYGAIYGLRDVTLHIGKGETVGLLGRNGAGKTTALNLITGYFPPTAGTVRIGGMDMLESARACRHMIGYLPERPPHVEEILTLCGLQETRGRLLGHMSKGYRQRAGIAQALCGSPEILILDEPTVGLDPKQTVEIRELIRRLQAEHTVVFSSHILSEVQQLCSRVIILDGGRMVRDFDRNEPETGTLRIRLKIAGEEGTVMPRLQHLDTDIRAELLPAEENGVTEARLVMEAGGDAGAAADRVFRLLAGAGIPVRMMRAEKETLEEVFLRETDRNNE